MVIDPQAQVFRIAPDFLCKPKLQQSIGHENFPDHEWKMGPVRLAQRPQDARERLEPGQRQCSQSFRNDNGTAAEECRGAGLGRTEDEESASRTVLQDVVFSGIKAQLAQRLLAFAGKNPALQSTLALLELELPKPLSSSPTRKQLCKMRRLGRAILRELAAGEDVQCLFQP